MASRFSYRFVAAFLPYLVSLSLLACSKGNPVHAGPPAVEVTTVVQKDVPITRQWVSTLDGLVNAQVRAQVSGLLIKQNYTNGAFVARGTPLFEIDPRPFQAAVDGASANLEQAKANLQRAEAVFGKTQLDVTRYTPLAKESAISQQELDDAVQANRAAKAQVEQENAAIESARAALESAKLNLSFTKVLSPIDGVAGIATAQIGDFVSSQGMPLTTVSTINPILADFTASEQEYLNAVRQASASGDTQEAALRKLQWQLQLADGTIYPAKGRFYALDRQVDVRTGAILVKVAFPNAGNVLRPGGFGNISTVVKVQKNALLIPQRSVSELQGGYLAAVVDGADKVHIQSIVVGPRVGGMWIVEQGLKRGDRVVADGVQKVRDGMEVQVKPYQPQGPDENPSANNTL